MSYPNEVLTEVSTLLIEAGLGPDQIAALAKDIPGECASMIEAMLEADYQRQQDRQREIFEAGEDAGYRRAMKEAGRGHLLR